MPRAERMATVDAAWLHMDAPDNRMVITAVMELDGAIERDTLASLLRERMVEVYPRFTQRIETGAIGEARWVPDDDFDLEAHLLHVGLPRPGGTAALQALVSDLMSGPLDPARPRWTVHLVDMDGGHSAIIARIHHALADGISLARVLLSLADPDVDVEVDRLAEEGSRWASFRAQAEGLIERGREALADPQSLVSREALVSRGQEVVSRSQESLMAAARLGGGSAAAVGRLLAMSDDPDSALRGPLTHRKRVAWSDGVELDRVKAVAKALGGTVNDVLLVVLSDALGRYLRDRGTPIEGCRTLVPVNLRPADRPVPRELGNRFGLVFLELPVGHQPARERFVTLKRRMDALKRSPEPALTHALLSAVGLTPVQVERLVVDVFGAKASLITTNVPGPRTPIRMAGAPVSRVLFWVPQAGAVGLGVSLFSYAGRVVWGVSGDRRRIPDPEAIVARMQDAFEDLERVAEEGSRAPRD